MSNWTNINGMITVEPLGRTQAEKRYILDTVLQHLPLVTGDEEDMNICVIQKDGRCSSSSMDEFGQKTNNLIDDYGQKSYYGKLEIQNEYIIIVYGSLRGRCFERTLKDFNKWLCRLARRVRIEDMLVEIKDYEKSLIIKNHEIGKDKKSNTAYGQMYEKPTWYRGNHESEPNWCEYLMWESMKGYSYPMTLAYKYYEDENNDKEVKRRLKYKYE